METLVPAPVHWVVATALSFDIILHKHRPASAVLWLAVAWAFPIWGALAYLVFGVDQIRRFASGPVRLERLFRSYVAPGPEELSEGAEDADGAIALHGGAHILRLTEPAVRPYRLTRGNRIELLVDGEEVYPAMASAIETARERIDLQTYILSRDRAGRGLLQRLTARAADGVRVRLLCDGFGSGIAFVTGFFRDAERAGVEVAASHPRGYPNLRNHRKVLVVDGRIGFVGGMNIDDRNLPQPDGRPADRDYHARVAGPVVRDLEFQFLVDWSRATGSALEGLTRDTPPRWAPTDGEALAQVIPGGPERSGSGLTMAFFGAIAAAQTSVTIVTPYFLPDDSILSALRYAATRGVDVRIVLPARSNHWYTAHAARALYGQLLEVGVRIYERRPPFIHAKALVVDDVYTLLGSANLDYRSLYLNFELDLEVASAAFAARVRRQLEVEMSESEEVSLEVYEARPASRRLTEGVCHLLAPML